MPSVPIVECDDDIEELDGVILDEEELAALKEIESKGYYHGRPKNEPCAPPSLINEEDDNAAFEAAAKEMSAGRGAPPSRAVLDQFQRKWDGFSGDDCVVSRDRPQERAKDVKSQLTDQLNACNAIGHVKDASELKDKGLTAYKANDFEGAIDFWILARAKTRQIFDGNLLKVEVEGKEGQRAEAQALEVSLDLNLAQAYLKVEDFSSASSYCEKALEWEPSNEKALYRKASAEFGQQNYEKTREVLSALFRVVPEHPAGVELIEQVDKKQKISSKKFKAGYKETILYQRAGEEFKSSKYAEAQETLKKLLTMAPEHADGQKLLKQIVKKDKDTKQAEKEAARKMFGGSIKNDPRIAKQDKLLSREAEKESEQEEVNPIIWLWNNVVCCKLCSRRKRD